MDGDGCLHFWFETKPAKTLADGRIVNNGLVHAEVLENIHVFFGNTESIVVETQPWILIRYRKGLEELKEWAAENGVDADMIRADKDTETTNSEHEGEKVTVLRKYWKQNGTVCSASTWCFPREIKSLSGKTVWNYLMKPTVFPNPSL